MSQLCSGDEALALAVKGLEGFHEVSERPDVGLRVDCFVDR